MTGKVVITDWVVNTIINNWPHFIKKTMCEIINSICFCMSYSYKLYTWINNQVTNSNYITCIPHLQWCFFPLWPPLWSNWSHFESRSIKFTTFAQYENAINDIKISYFTFPIAFLYLVIALFMRSATGKSPVPHGTKTFTRSKHTVTFIGISRPFSRSSHSHSPFELI